MSNLNRAELRARRSKPLCSLPRAPRPSLRAPLVRRTPLAEGEGAADRRGPAELSGGRGGSPGTRRVHGRPLPLGHSEASLAQVGGGQHVRHQTLRRSSSDGAQRQGPGPPRREPLLQTYTGT